MLRDGDHHLPRPLEARIRIVAGMQTEAVSSRHVRTTKMSMVASNVANMQRLRCRWFSRPVTLFLHWTPAASKECLRYDQNLDAELVALH